MFRSVITGIFPRLMIAGSEQEAGVRPRDSGLALSVSDGATLLPVSPAGCLHLAHAVLASLQAAEAGVAEAWLRAALDPAVAAWLAAERLAATGHPHPSAVSPAASAARLRAAVTTTNEAEAARSPEAMVLLGALAAAEELRGLRGEFAARVAEARLAALREFAYGAGHEINNPLANIAARAQALLLDEQDHERRRRLATIVDQAFRARDMIGGLMIFARPPLPQATTNSVDAVVRPVVEDLVPQAVARGIRLEYSPPPALLSVHVDATQVGEAVRMLLVNALEAVADGGRILVEAGRDPGSDQPRILIGDDGPGMDPETAARAGDPFFSGREAGRGIGLGLPKARRLIESSGGSLAIESRPGQGTRCLVVLPVEAPGS